MLSGLEYDDVNKIVEMLNGDAIEAAAEAAGIKTNRITDIFEKILNSN